MRKIKQDRWFIQNWAQARQFEDAMAAVRQSYQDLFTDVHQRVKRNHPELDSSLMHRLKDKVTEAHYDESGGCVAFFRAMWIRKWNAWPSGIWISNISLDELVSETGPTPTTSIWLSVAKNDKRVEMLRSRLLMKIRRVRHPRS